MKFMQENVDNREIGDLVTQAGFRHKRYEVATEDGYILQLHRIVNEGAFNVVYFQHGVLDNAIAWLVQGRDQSQAYLAYRLGFDVWFGNFRGVYPRKVTKERQSENESKDKENKNYWDYTIDHLAKYDLQAFMEEIIQVKT